MLGMLDLFKYYRRNVHKIMYILNMDLSFKKGSSSKIKFVESSGSRWGLKCVYMCVWERKREGKDKQSLRTALWVGFVVLEHENKEETRKCP